MGLINKTYFIWIVFFFLSGWGEEEVSWEGKFFGCWFFFLFLLTHFVPVCAWASVCACVRVQLFEQLVSLASLANVNIDSENSIKDWETLLSLPPMHYIIYKCIYIYIYEENKTISPGVDQNLPCVAGTQRERDRHSNLSFDFLIYSRHLRDVCVCVIPEILLTQLLLFFHLINTVHWYLNYPRVFVDKKQNFSSLLSPVVWKFCFFPSLLLAITTFCTFYWYESCFVGYDSKQGLYYTNFFFVYFFLSFKGKQITSSHLANVLPSSQLLNNNCPPPPSTTLLTPKEKKRKNILFTCLPDSSKSTSAGARARTLTHSYVHMAFIISPLVFPFFNH